MKPQIFDENNNWIAGRKRPFFKYLKAEYATSMLRYGRMRIGTLHDFRRVEHYDAARADIDEGVHKLDILVEQSVHHRGHEPTIQYYLDQFGVEISYSTNTRVTGSIHSENCYIYSFSDKLNWTMANDFDADACVIIWDIKKLIETMIASDDLDVELIELGPVRYVEDSHDVRKLGRIAPAFIKKRQFSSQDEWRLILPPKQRSEIIPKRIELGSLEDICSIIYPHSFISENL